MSEENIKEKQQKNRELVERYPFLLPRHGFDDEPDEDYDYSYTELDLMPNGWREAFGEMLCEELREELVKFDFLEEYRILEIKEKYGGLRWYDYGTPRGSKIHDIIGKYEVLSQNICINCGKPDVPMCGDYWISPFCEECYGKFFRNSEENGWGKYAVHGTRMPDSYRYRTSEGAPEGGWVDVTVDVSETAEKIRKRYKERQKCLENGEN